MLKIVALVVTVALGDSLNPSTIGPALYIASGTRARIAVLEFTVAVFVVHSLAARFSCSDLGTCCSRSSTSSLRRPATRSSSRPA
jgi:hypothetical protein